MEIKEIHVFWDIENCQVPSGIPAYHVVKAMKTVILRYGPINSIVAIAKLQQIANEIKTSLQDSGIIMQDVSSGKPSAADIAILGEIMKLIFEKKPPLGIVLITGDRDFSKIVNFLVDRGYFVLLIHPENVSNVLQISASEHLPWNEVLTPILHLKKPDKVTVSEIEPNSLNSNTNINSPYNYVIGMNGNANGTPVEIKKKRNLQLFPPDSSEMNSRSSPIKSLRVVGEEEGPLIQKMKKNAKENLVGSKWLPLLKALRSLLLAKKVESVHYSTLTSYKHFNFKDMGYSKLKLCLEDAKSEQLILVSEDGLVSMLQKGWKVLKKNKAKDSNPSTPSKEEKSKTPTVNNASNTLDKESSSSVLSFPKNRKKEKKESMNELNGTESFSSSSSTIQMVVEDQVDEKLLTNSSSLPSLISSSSSPLTNETPPTSSSSKKKFGADFNFVLYYLALWRKV